MVLSKYKDGWEKEFQKYPGMMLEYTPLDLAWKASYYIGLRQDYPVFFAKSGYSSFFLYDLEKPWVYDVFRFSAVDSALDVCDVKRYQALPKDLPEALEFIKTMVDSGRLVWISWFDPLLVYGLEVSAGSLAVNWYHPTFAPDGSSWGMDELAKWWEWTDNPESKKLIAPSEIKCDESITEKDLVPNLAEMIVKNFRQSFIEMDGKEKVPMGLAAYDAYIKDLSNPDVDFLVENENGDRSRLAWFDAPIYSQWTQNYALHSYFYKISRVIPQDLRENLTKAADCFGNAYANWKKWHKLVGRKDDADEFLRCVAYMKKRIQAAEKVKLAKTEIEKALVFLEKIIPEPKKKPSEKPKPDKKTGKK